MKAYGRDARATKNAAPGRDGVLRNFQLSG